MVNLIVALVYLMRTNEEALKKLKKELESQNVHYECQSMSNTFLIDHCIACLST